MDIMFNLLRKPTLRKPTDKNAPKKPLSSFRLFCKDQRPEIKKQNPELKAKQISEKLTNLWSNMDTSEKSKWEDMAKQKYEEYCQELETYHHSEKYQQYVTKIREFEQMKRDEKDKLHDISETQFNKDEIKEKIKTFFEKYRQKLRESRYPRECVSNQYGNGVDYASQWIIRYLYKKMKNIEACLYAFERLLNMRPNIEKMDFSCGGPGHEVWLMIQRIELIIDNEDTNKFNKANVRSLRQALEKCERVWDQYDPIDTQTLISKINEKFQIQPSKPKKKKNDTSMANVNPQSMPVVNQTAQYLDSTIDDLTYG